MHHRTSRRHRSPRLQPAPPQAMRTVGAQRLAVVWQLLGAPAAMTASACVRRGVRISSAALPLTPVDMGWEWNEGGGVMSQ
jgi:hypothetical protein